MSRFLAAVGASYLLGSIPTAFLLVQRLKRVDVRTVGSGNVGATNVARVAGLKAGALVFAADVAKGFVAATWLTSWLLPSASDAQRLAVGLAAILGHCFPVFLRFRGGKGVATTIGVLVGAAPLAAGVFLLTWGACYAIGRYVSIGSLAAAATIPVTQQLAGAEGQAVGLGAAIALLILVRHHGNIRRLLRGEEHRASPTRR